MPSYMKQSADFFNKMVFFREIRNIFGIIIKILSYCKLTLNIKRIK